MSDLAPLPYPWSEIRARLQAAFPELLAQLGLRHELRTRPRGSIWPTNPMRADKRPGSFVIWTEGGFIGAWKDYASDQKGDVFDLIAGIERLASKIDTYWWALDFLGLDRKGAATQPRTKAADAQERERRALDAAAAEAQRTKADAARSKALFMLWLGLKPIAGTPAETYLRVARGVPLERLKALPGALRWAPAVDWIEPETGEVFTWRHVMAAAMTRGSVCAALHLTFIKPDGSGKADIAKPKRMFGPISGAAIRLSPGPSGLSPSQAAKKGRLDPLAIGEGIETSATVACARPDYRVWAAGSLSLMGLLDWPACASAVVLLRDNDWKPEAQAAFARIEAHWRRQAEGRPVHVVGSKVGSDFNDWEAA